MATNLEIWQPGTDITVDEIMVPFQGRSHEVTHIPGKPNPDGIKVWGLAQTGFLIVWNWHTPGQGNGPKNTSTPRELGGTKGGKNGNKTQAVVAKLVAMLPKDNGNYHLWIDNLFTSTRFLEFLRTVLNCGATGTTRTNSGIVQPLLDLKASDKNDKLPWGTIQCFSTPSNLVRHIGWKDSAFTLMMSTVYSGEETILRQRRRPKQGQKKEMAKHAPFKGKAAAMLAIPICFDQYNQHMGQVDNFDQLTSSCPGWRPIRRGGWQAIEHWLLLVVLINTYVIVQQARKASDILKSLRNQQEHREAIYEGLLKLAQHTHFNPKKRPMITKETDELDIRGHCLIRIESRLACVYCAGKRPSSAGFRVKKRKVLGEASMSDLNKNTRTSMKCKECNMAFCNPKTRGCFDNYHRIS